MYSTVSLALMLIVAVFTSYAGTACSEYRLGETVLFRIDTEKTFCFCCCCSSCVEVGVLGWHIADCSGRTVYAVVHDVAVPASVWEGRWGQIGSSETVGYGATGAASGVVTLGYSQAAAATASQSQATASASASAGSWATTSPQAAGPTAVASGLQVAAGYYTLYVDTTAGTLSRCLKLYDPCCFWCRPTCWGWSGGCFDRCCSYKETQTIKACCCRISLELDVERPKCYLWPFSPCCCP